MDFWAPLSNLISKVKRVSKVFDRKPSGSVSEKDPLELAGIVRQMAETGIGTDACLEHGCLPMLVHYYSPVPDIADLEQRRVWDRRSGLAGIDFGTDKQVDFLVRLGKEFGGECQWPYKPTSDPLQFFTDNGCFSFGN